MKRFTMIIMAAIAATLPAVVADPASTNASSGYDEIFSTEPVNVRVTPNVSGQVIAQLEDGTPTNIRCAIAGQQIWDTNVWFYSDLSNGERGFWTAYYSDAVYETWNDLSDRYGISRCERPASTPGASVYYQPRFHLGDPLAPTSAYTAAKDYWAAGNCSADSSIDHWPAHFDGQLVTRASGWSLGRLGITYMLSLNDNPTRADNLNEIILFDPGNLDEYANNPCDAQYDQDQLMADWLSGDDDRRLLVIAGAWTRDASNPDAEGRMHQGIQQHLFPAIRNLDLSDQVLVCNYDSMGHVEIMETFGHLAGSGSLTTCPGAPDHSWNPGNPPPSDPCRADFHPEMTVTFGGFSHAGNSSYPAGDFTTIDVDVMWPEERLRFSECRPDATAEISLFMGISNNRHQVREMAGHDFESDLPAFYNDVSEGNPTSHEMSFGTADATALEPGRWYNAQIVLEGTLGSDELLDVQMSRGYRWSIGPASCPATGTIVSAWCVSGWTNSNRYGPEYTELIDDAIPAYFDPIHGSKFRKL